MPTVERVFDLALLSLLSPLIVLAAIVIAAAIYLDSPGPVIFVSERVGKDGRRFPMFKFRKMRRDAAGHLLTQADDARFTPIGRFLSATRLDELPQAWNVVRGEMRLVGPRPELAPFVDEFSEPYREILTVTPGITGPAQLRFVDEKSLLGGHHDPAAVYRDHVLPAKIRIDVNYVRTRSLAGDVAIILRTVVLPLQLILARARARVRRAVPWAPAVGLATICLIVLAVSSSNLS
jgi:lipopolysaccharide/colanic/teichoic acid biosynthesis glycosyltransferase